MAMAQTVINWAACPVLESDAERLSGAWVFRGTRVPISTVLENLSDMSVDEIVGEYPTVQRGQITAFLDFVARSVESHPVNG
jgi:uncharacterized protein (DUF433 family)